MNEQPPVTRIAMVRVRSRVKVTGVIRLVHTESVGVSPAVRAVLADGSGQLDLIFLGRESMAGLVHGRRCTAEGRASAYMGRLVLWNPRYELEPPEPDAVADDEDVAAARVLVVGDDPGLCRVIEVNLAARGYRVDTVTPVSADSLAGHCPSLVIVDLGVADTDGMELIPKLRGPSGGIPVLVVSARDSEEVKRAAFVAGAADFLTKPFSIQDLLDKVRRAASSWRDGEETARR